MQFRYDCKQNDYNIKILRSNVFIILYNYIVYPYDVRVIQKETTADKKRCCYRSFFASLFQTLNSVTRNSVISNEQSHETSATVVTVVYIFYHWGIEKERLMALTVINFGAMSLNSSVLFELGPTRNYLQGTRAL